MRPTSRCPARCRSSLATPTAVTGRRRPRHRGCLAPAGNRLPDPEFYPDTGATVWADNRITEDMQYLYRYDRYGRLTEKTDRIPEGVIRMNDERTHRYEYDNQHRLVHYVRTQHNSVLAEGRYLYDPLGRRVGKRVWKRELVHWSDTRMELSR
ncbi:RHS repeat protein, partial [Salmonella enterica subsp. enterica]|nr:RHS repeat protein [Salmonella enterica subsp. enterica]